MACARCGGFLVIEGWGGLIENIRERLLRTMRCVNCGSIDDSVILANRLIERSAICCTTH
jgi:hypothetical protein